MTSGVSLALTACYLSDGVSVRGAQLPVLRLAHCRAENPSLAPLDAERFSTQVLDLRGLTVVTDARNTGAISLAYAHIAGELDASGANLTIGSGPALDANRLQVDGDLRLRHGFDAVGSSRSGAVVLTGSRIGGILDFSGAKLTNDAGWALAAEELRVDGVLLFTDRFEAVGKHVDGAVLLRGVHIGGQLVAVGATLTNESGPALSAARLRVDLDVFLIDGFSASGKGDDGAVLLRGAHIGGQLTLRKATLANQAGPALSADRLQVDGDVFLVDGFSASGNKDTDGAVSLFGAHIGGQLAINKAILANDVGPALNADALQVDGDLSLVDGFSASGSGDAGAVSLVNADIGGQFTASAATLTNPSGPALSAAGLHVDGDLHLVDGFKADGWGQRGALLLSGAHIGGQLEATGATVTNQGGPALCADDLRVDSDLL
jgi:adhesin HecA-like repeat protein